ncbi:MAG: helix-turn-helix domain-containing protein [Chloroflexi bacterium]|nr:helix-turn-helix domain-containing protein [Chloroflexota bacterium]
MPETRPAVMEERAAIARDIGRRLAAARQRAGLSQAAAARALGVPQSQIAKLELGLRQLLLFEAVQLMGLYAVEVRDLISPPLAERPAMPGGS